MADQVERDVFFLGSDVFPQRRRLKRQEFWLGQGDFFGGCYRKSMSYGACLLGVGAF